MKMRDNKKGQSVMDNLGSLAIGIATFAIVMVVTFLILANAQDQIVETQGALAGNTTAFNASQNLTNATAGVIDWVPLIIIVVIGALILGLIKRFR